MQLLKCWYVDKSNIGRAVSDHRALGRQGERSLKVRQVWDFFAPFLSSSTFHMIILDHIRHHRVQRRQSKRFFKSWRVANLLREYCKRSWNSKAFYCPHKLWEICSYFQNLDLQVEWQVTDSGYGWDRSLSLFVCHKAGLYFFTFSVKADADQGDNYKYE